MVDHWFDTLNKRMRHGAPRRALIGVVVGTIARCTLGDDPRTDAAKKRTKRRRKTGDEATPQRPRDWIARAVRGHCKAVWPSTSPSDTDNRDYCEFICEQCDGDDPRDFCLIKDPARDDLVAFCCPQKAVCCGGICCGPDPAVPGRRCCDQRCVNTHTDVRHCGQCRHRCPAGSGVRSMDGCVRGVRREPRRLLRDRL